jgi:hypothetical protein
VIKNTMQKKKRVKEEAEKKRRGRKKRGEISQARRKQIKLGT